MAKQIFIGGTGRSGTSILARHIGNHKDIFQVPLETRFMVNKDGLVDLYTDLSSNFSISHGRLAIERFVRMIEHMSNKYNAPFVGYDLPGLLGKDRVSLALDELLRKISVDTYHGWDRDTRDPYLSYKPLLRMLLVQLQRIEKLPLIGGMYRKKRIRYKDIVSIETHFIPKYFDDESMLQEVLGAFVEQLFGGKAEEIGKKHWLEATPQNILHVDILGKIFPEAYFINVVRHPVGVFYSWKGRSWGPSDITRLSAYLHEGYKKMKDMEDYAQKNGVNLKVFKLEDLCQSYILHSVTDFLGVDRIKTSREVFDISRVDYWKQGIDRSEMDIVQEVFSEFIERYDYSKV